MTRPLPRRYLAVALIALLAVLVGVSGPLALAGPSAKDLIAADPPPALFPDRDLAPLAGEVTAQSERARALLAPWWRTHGRSPHDAAFIAWVERALPGPPGAGPRTAEVAAVARLARTRTPAGVTASTWLETHGKRDVWKLFVHDQAELLPPAAGDARKQTVKDLLTLSKTVADALGARYRQSAPYVLRPDLRPEKTVAPGQVCPCSYPSRHAAAAAAAETYLAARDPHRAAEYRWMRDQIDWSRVYMAGHVPSDIVGGTLLGDLVGRYVEVTRP